MEKINFKNKKIAVVGYGVEGRDAIDFLLNQGSQVTLFDQKEESEIDISELKTKGVSYIVGSSYLDKGFEEFDLIVRSPGVYRFLPQLVNAEKHGVVLTSAIKIFFDLCPAKIIGVTGTKGKGTTSTLITKIIEAAGEKVHLAGNIGKPCLSLLSSLTTDDWVVLELSSFQLIDLTKSPHIAVVLNITEDHLDWHKDIDEYIQAKTHIVAHQTENDFAVINEEYETSKKLAILTKAKVIFFSKQNLEEKYKKDLLLRGKHNLENIAAAVSVAKILKIKDSKIIDVVANFKGLEHRLELVDTINGVSFYNDSFATNPQPTLAAVESFDEPIHLILGGSDKGLSYDELAREISKRKNIKSIILIGHIADQIEDSLKRANCAAPFKNFGETKQIDEIVKWIFEQAQKGDVVLLSPASASFGMFTDYKDRGNKFKVAVQKLQTDS